MRTIGETSTAHLFVATILPQKAPSAGWEKVDIYNASLPAIVASQKASGKRITLVDIHAGIARDDLLPGGVIPYTLAWTRWPRHGYEDLRLFTGLSCSSQTRNPAFILDDTLHCFQPGVKCRIALGR